MELIAINNAAIEGVRRMPYLGYKMPAAKGIAVSYTHLTLPTNREV